MHISNVKVTDGRTAFNVSGTKESIVKNFTLTDVDIQARNTGSINYASGWKFNDVTMKTQNDSKLRVENSTDMDL